MSPPKKMTYKIRRSNSTTISNCLYCTSNCLISSFLYLKLFSLYFLHSGQTGSKTFVSKRFLPRGGKEKEGVRVRTVNSTYFWTHLEGTDFSLGVVVPVSHAKDVLNTMQIPQGKSY